MNISEYRERSAQRRENSVTQTAPTEQVNSVSQYRERSAQRRDSGYQQNKNEAKKRTSYINSFLKEAGNFFKSVEGEINNSDGFNAAEFFERRKKQADSLKAQASIASQYLNEYADKFSQEDYDYLRDYFSGFDTQIDDVLAYYQPSIDARAGMQNYQNEYAAYLEDQAGKKQAMYDTAAVVDSPAAYALLRFAGDMVSPVQRGITDQWTDEQRYILGTLQNEDPREARKYARNVNKGQDPYQIAAANEQEEQELLALDLTAAQRELDELNAQYDNYQYDASTFRGRMAAEADLKRMEQEISQKQQIINRAKLVQDRQRLGAVRSNDDFAAMSAYQEGINDPVYAYVNSAYGAREFMDRAHNPAIKDAYDQMTEEEIANFNYHYATGGKEQAQRYLDTIAETLNQRKAGKMYESIKGQTAKELLFGAGAGLNQAAEGFQNLFNFEDDYITPSAYQIAGGMVREDLADSGWTLPEWMGGASLGQVGYDLINTAANMAPSMAIGAINPIAGTLTMGASAAGGAYQEALNEGYSKQQARTYSALVGASEAGLEYLLGGISTLGGVVPGGIVEKMLDGVDNAFKRFAIEMGGSVIGEGFEEGLQEVLTPYFQNLAMNTDEDVNWDEVAYSALLGALSGGVMEAPGTAINAATYSLRNRPGTGSSSAPSTPALTENDIKAKVTEDGRSRIVSTNESVDVNDFASIKNGDASILLSNGNTAPMDDVNFASTEEAARFMTIKSLPGIETEAANDLYHAMKDNNAGSDTDTIVGVRDAYALGYYGFQKSDATKYGTDAAKLSPALRAAAFEAGRKQRSMNAAVAPKVSAPSTAVKPASGYKRVVFEGKVKLKNNPKAKAEVHFMDFVAEKFSGTTVHVYQSFKGKDGKYYYRDSHGKIVEAPNGRYVNDEIWIDLNSGDKGEGLVLNTFAHEMYHHVEKWNQKGAQKLAEFVVKELGIADVKSAVNEQIKKAEAAGYGVEHFMKYGNNGKGMTREQAINAVEQRAMSDFVADSLETMFSRGDAAEVITRLKEEDRGLFDKIKEFVDQWVSTLKQWYSDKTISQEGKKVAQLERFEELQKLFLEAVTDAGENYNAAKETADNKKIKASPAHSTAGSVPVNNAGNTSGNTVTQTPPTVNTGMNSLRNAPENIHDVRRRIATAMDDAANTGNLKKWAGEYREKIAQAETIESNLKIKDQQIQELESAKNPKDKQKFYALRKEVNQMRDELGKLNKRIQYIESLKAFRDISAGENAAYSKSLLQQMRNQQAENIQQQLIENRIVREELTGKDSDITIMEKEFIRIVKKYEQLEEKAGANATNKSKTISKLRTALKEEAASHDEDSKIWEREYNRLLREYESSGQKIERMERSISRRKETAKQQIERKKVEEKAKALMKMLTYPTKDAHVPMELQQPLQKFLDSIDFTSPRQLGGGTATIKDIAYTRALVELRSAIASQRTAVESSDDDGVFTLDVPPDFLEEIDKHIKTINDATSGLDLTTNRVYEMSSDELKDLSYILKVVNKAVREIDRLHMQGEKARTSALAKDTMQEMNRRPATKSEKGNWFMWNNYTPYQAFRRYGKAAQKIFAGLTDGQAKLARTIDSTLKFTKDTYTAEEVRNWERTRHTIKLDSGKTVTMTPAQIMSFWCLSHRNQAIPHMQGAGIRISTLERVLDGTKVQKEVVQREHYTLTVEDVNRINDMLTNRQKDVARKLQQYMQRVGGRLINEVSMARWDFMAATETDYFPIQTEDSGRDVKNPDQNKTSLFALLNKSFTKTPMKNAKNALVIGSIFDVFANHMSETAEYNAFALPLIDALKWFNYRERIDIGKGHIKDIGVHKAIKDTLGTEATRYFVDLMTDINSSQKAGRHEDFFGKILGRSKAASVGWNIRVAIQQPSAIFRASMVLKPGSLVRGIIKKGTVAEMQKYSGIALWKSMGYYDLNVARSVEDQIKGDTSFADKFSDMGMWLPGKMDEWTWGWIWESTKNQVRAETKLSGEELLRATAKKFDDVVYQTQVADSVLTRSSFMRSKSQMVKEATSFMAEPTLSLNVLMSAFQDYEEGHTSWVKAKRGMMIGFTGYVLSGLANALLSSIVDAGRDDDEWETFLEKYGQALLGENFWDGNLFNEMNPLNKIIFVKDFLSSITGYENQSSYGKVISGLIDLANAVRDGMTGKTSKTTYGIIYQGLQYISTITGIGLSNMTREVVGVWNNTFGKLYPDMRLVRYKPNNGEDLLLAIQKGNEADIERVAGRFDDQKSAESALKTAVATHYKDGSMTAEEATEILLNYTEMEEDDVYWKIEEWNFARDNGSAEDYAKYNSLHAAIDSGAGFEAEIDRHMEHGAEPDEIRAQISRVYHKAYLEASEDEREQIREKVAPAYLYAGLDEDDLESKFHDWDFEAEYGMSYSEYKAGYLDDSVSRFELEDAMKFYGLKNYQISETFRSMDKDKKFRDRFGMSLTQMKDGYDDGDVSRNQLINALVYNGMTQKEASQEVTQRDIRNRLGIDYSELDDAYKHGDITRQTLYNAMIENGATRQEADESIQSYDWLKKHVKQYPDLTVSDGKKFSVSLGDNAEGYTLEDFGVSIDSYIEYKQKLPDCQGVDANGDGKTDSGTKRDSVFRMIDSLPISDEAKDGLALMSYSKNSIKKNAPWH